MSQIKETADSEVQMGDNRFCKKRNKSLITAAVLSCCIVTAVFSGCSKAPNAKELRSNAIEFYEAGDYESAAEKFDEALEKDRGKVGEFQLDILRYRGECELRLGHYTEAKKTYEALITADKNDKNKKYYEELKADLDCLDEIKNAVEELNKGNYEDAYEVFDGYAKLDGTLKGKLAWFNQGVCAEYMHRYDEAYELFNQYLKVYPEDEDAIKEMNFLKTR